MSSNRKIIAILVISNILTASFALKIYWDKLLFQTQVFGLATYAGALQAANDFQNNKFRLYELKEDGNLEFTGKKEGPFELWYWPYHPITFDGGKEMEVQSNFTTRYNRSMRRLYQKSPGSEHTAFDKE